MLLDGGDPRFEWVVDPRARDPGIVPAELAPQLERTDYVFNANDSHWISNAKTPLTGFSPVHGGENSPRSLRTRMNVLLLEDASPSGPAGADGRFSLDEVATAVFSNRSMSAELLKPSLVARCQAAPERAVDGRTIDITAACGVLGAWNGAYDLDSRGAVLWREFITQFRGADFTRAGRLFAKDFDPAEPVTTPRDLAAGTGGQDPVLDVLARAVIVLEQAGLRADAPLGEVQIAERGGKRIPIHGGLGGEEGIANFVNFAPNDSTLESDGPPMEAVKGSRYLTRAGYRVNRGSSFVMVLGYTDGGPRARALLTYGESGDPLSPHFSDQTELFSRKAWRDVLFTEEEIAADPNLRTEVVRARAR
jgi:acyl-homoserine-lactone acylase